MGPERVVTLATAEVPDSESQTDVSVDGWNADRRLWLWCHHQRLTGICVFIERKEEERGHLEWNITGNFMCRGKIGQTLQTLTFKQYTKTMMKWLFGNFFFERCWKNKCIWKLFVPFLGACYCESRIIKRVLMWCSICPCLTEVVMFSMTEKILMFRCLCLPGHQWKRKPEMMSRALNRGGPCNGRLNKNRGPNITVDITASCWSMISLWN